MFNIPYDDIVNKIVKEKGVSKQEVEEKVNSKLQQLSGLISKEGAAHIVANELGVNLYEDIIRRKLKIHHIVPGMRNVNLVARVLKLYELREFDKNGRKGKVRNILVGDESGILRLVFWGSHADEIDSLEEGNIIKINNCTARENNGYKELHTNDKSKIEINPEGESIAPLKERPKPVQIGLNKRSSIPNLKENGYAELLGVIVQVFEPRFYASCPDCFRKVELKDNVFHCTDHGVVKERMVPIVNVIFDDGTDTVRVVCFRSQAEMMMGLTEEKMYALKDNMNEFEQIKQNVLGRQMFIAGKARMNEFFGRLEFIAQNVYEADPKELAEDLIKQIP